MDRTAFGRKTPNRQKARVDRFVVPREVINDVRRRRRRCNSCDKQDLDIWFTKYLQKKNYTSYVDQAFGLEPNSQPEVVEQVRAWPCLPRTKSYLSSADSILDLPSYNDAAFPELLDWSNENILVAALGKKYHKWSWRSQCLISQGLSGSQILCCKFDPSGELLALGTDKQVVEIHNNVNKHVGLAYCMCMGLKYCSITALDWSPTGNSLALGCSSGVVVSATRDSRFLSSSQVSRGEPVLVVRISPDARFAAVATVNSSKIVLLTWPKLQMHSSMESNGWTIKTCAWHPWRSALLGVAEVTADNQSRISLWDAPTTKIRETICQHRNYLDAMLFSHKTGELVLSLLDTERATYPRSCSQLVVMSGPDTVVDCWGEGRTCLDRVRTMVFSPDGTKLATATSDEDLIIWNFLPEDNNKKVKNRRFSAIPVYLDESTYGCSFR